MSCEKQQIALGRITWLYIHSTAILLTQPFQTRVFYRIPQTDRWARCPLSNHALWRRHMISYAYVFMKFTLKHHHFSSTVEFLCVTSACPNKNGRVKTNCLINENESSGAITSGVSLLVISGLSKSSGFLRICWYGYGEYYLCFVRFLCD